MKPRDLPSRYKKILPWYYIRVGSPSRRKAQREAIAADLRSSQEPDDFLPCRGVTCVHPCGAGPCQWESGDEQRLEPMRRGS